MSLRWLLLASLLLCACREDVPAKREPPPPPPKPATCDAPARFNDPKNVEHLPKKVGTYCLDPSGSDRAFGEGAASPLDGICDLFDGECEIYKRHKVSRVVEARYVDGGGSGASIDVYLSKFESPEHAYAMFTKRVVGDGDPAHPDTPRAIPGGGQAALGIGNAYLWRAAFLAELTYNDDQASAAQIQKRGGELLPGLAKELGDALPGKADLPADAAALPAADRLPLGLRYLAAGQPFFQGLAAATGPGAFGYYRRADKRWRMLALVRGSEAEAKDALAALAIAGASGEKDLGDGGHRAMIGGAGETPAEWLFARKGSRVFGIGDESRVLRGGMTADEHGSVSLSLDEKRELLRALLR